MPATPGHDAHTAAQSPAWQLGPVPSAILAAISVISAIATIDYFGWRSVQFWFLVSGYIAIALHTVHRQMRDRGESVVTRIVRTFFG